jgi:hypothetical protein
VKDLVQPCNWCAVARKAAAAFIQSMSAQHLACEGHILQPGANQLTQVSYRIDNTLRVHCSACKDTELLLTDEGKQFLRIVRANVTDDKQEIPF